LEEKKENAIVVDSITNVITAFYTSNELNKKVIEMVVVDVPNDAIWVDYFKLDTLLHYADRTSIKRPISNQ